MRRLDEIDLAPVVGVALAVATGVAAVAGSFAVAGFRPGFVVAPVSATLTRVAPGVTVTWTIENLGSLGHQLVLVGAVVVTVALFAVVAVLGRRVSDRPERRLLSVALGVAAVAVALTGDAFSAAGAAIVSTVVVALGELGGDDGDEPVSVARRRVLRAGAAAVAAVGIAALIRPRQTEETGGGADADESQSQEDLPVEVQRLLGIARERSLAVTGIDPLVTDTAKFYEVDIANVNPDLSPDEWSLRVTGAVDEERTFTFEEVTSLPAEHRFVTLRYVGDQLNGRKVDNALWTGVSVMDLLGETGLPDECCVMLRAADDYYEEFPLSALRNGFLAYKMNGRPLPRSHGAPVRALIPGHWGEINVKWLTEIEVLDEPVDGYWEERGWHGTGPVKTVAKLHAVNNLDDGRIQVGGHAYAGTRGIERVEVSVDDGETWAEARLSEPLPGRVAAEADGQPVGDAEDAWQMWEHVYEATESHTVVVRAVDGTGEVQKRADTESGVTRPFPSGPDGWVSMDVNP
ncbi:MAG: molybdopterin-dependent oxidoreductase [Halobacteriota archaeon]